MWRRIYLVLLVFRLYFALSPSYLHPDENFQGPEVIAGQVFSYPVHHTWEFTASHPIRSVFPLWLVYGLPMLILRALWGGVYKDELPPAVVYWTLRILMFTLSFVLEDWALQELVSSRQRRVGMILVASSYVTWTYQTHTFSNAIETLVVLWSLVLITRITEVKERTGAFACVVLAFLLTLGVFNRITFPAYLLIPGLQLLRHFRRRPLSLVVLAFFGIIFTSLAILLDTSFYQPEIDTFIGAMRDPVITPWNNFIYNYSPTNLAQHGLHPFYQHIVANLPLLLGPAYLLIPFCHYKTMRIGSAIGGVVALSLFPHQEARFLIPAVPLILSSVRLPAKFSRTFIGSWVAFNLFMGVLMGTYHQGGVVPMQIHISNQLDVKHAFWWKTYSPPIWLLDGRNDHQRTTDFMGMPSEDMLRDLKSAVSCSSKDQGVFLVAPASATVLSRFTSGNATEEIILEERWRYKQHLNLDDMDFAEDGIKGTLLRVVGKRGLVLWHVKRRC